MNLSLSEQPLAEWFDTPFGRYLWASERAMLQQRLPELSGYHLMQLGVAGRDIIEDDFGHSHKFSMAAGMSKNVATIADFESLPLPSDTVDTALLHHALEFSVNPHQVLNEVARVISPGGHVILVVFNTYSSFGLSKAVVGPFLKSPVWHHHNLRFGRLLDWLRLLGFQPLQSFRGCHQLPLQWSKWLDKTRVFRRLDNSKLITVGGSFYVIVARKQVAPLTPVGKTRWQPLKVPSVPVSEKTRYHIKRPSHQTDK